MKFFRTRKKRQRKSKRRSRQRGVALIMVLGALTILTVMLTEVQDENSAELGSALSARDALIAEYAAKSAVNLSRLLIASEPTIRQSLGFLAALINNAQIPVWDHADKVLGAFNDTSGSEAFSGLAGVDAKQGKNLGLEGAGFEIRIIDEDSKINLNGPARGSLTANMQLASQLLGLVEGPQYGPLFDNRDADGNFSDRQTICSAIIDWTDPDETQDACDPHSGTSPASAAEDSYYQLLKKPYSRKNAAFDSLEELRLVRGIGEDFWTTFVEPDPEKPDKRIVTVWGNSAGDKSVVNVNTANAQTLLALICANADDETNPCKSAEEMAKFLTAVTMIKGFLPGIPMFGSPNAFVKFVEQPGAAAGGQNPSGGAQNPPGGGSPFGGGGDMMTGLLSSMGLKPVKLRSATELKKSITTESKIFSMYATGYVKSGKRETKVRVHAVVDFRGVPTIEDLANQLASAAAGGAGQPGANPPSTGAQTNPPAGTDPNAVAGALKPTPAGNIVYYRID